jgi:hypothetical protein
LGTIHTILEVSYGRGDALDEDPEDIIGKFTTTTTKALPSNIIYTIVIIL